MICDADACIDTHDRDTSGLEDLRQFHSDMRQHVVVRSVFGVRGVEVEPGSDTKVPVVSLTFDTGAAWGCIREEKRDALNGCNAEKSTFLGSANIRAYDEF